MSRPRGFLRLLRTLLLLALPASLLALSAGCNAVGVVAASIPDPPIAAAYPGLRGQSVGIMAWADRATRIDFPTIEGDLSRGLQQKLQEAADAGTKEVKDIHWASADAIMRFQENHPEMETEPAEELATQLPVPVTRLIYVEIVSFSLHSNESVDLSRGVMTANLKVVEVTNGVTKVAYEENDLTAVYPSDAPSEGVPGLADSDVYQQTVDALTTELAKRFITRDADTK
jgi:hypothetical protein